MRLINFILPALIIATVSLGAKNQKYQTPTASPVETHAPKLVKSSVAEVLSGDILKTENGWTIYLIGVDCFEPVEQAWIDSKNPHRFRIAKEALERVISLIQGKEISLEFVSEYQETELNRWAFVYYGVNDCLNLQLLSEGYGQILPGMPKHSKSFEFSTAQKNALTDKKGIWAIDKKSIRISTKDSKADIEEKPAIPASRMDRDQNEPSDSAEHSRIGIFLTVLAAAIIAGLTYVYKSLRATKPCPMCGSKMPIRATICPECNYNYKTGYLGDAELQTWVTQNMRVAKKKGEPRKKPKKQD